ncbi:MAG: DUF3310 domain-containing protein [Ruminococcus sp.]|nr:DUF3310 domain-containing protein [Oscillospiraceae bacterium]MBQ6250145.1 DUF3310 domain-containing protein [Ruminococcus sp.]
MTETTDTSKSSAVQNDPVNHPAHYTAGGIEVIDFLEAWNFPFHLANAIKYISRAGRKDKNALVTDLKKAVWYINRYIDYVEKQGLGGKEGKS